MLFSVLNKKYQQFISDIYVTKYEKYSKGFENKPFLMAVTIKIRLVQEGYRYEKSVSG